MLIRELFGNRPVVNGDKIGLEVEVEGARLPKELPERKRLWAITHDGSLQGEALEYIFARPLGYKQVGEALEQLAEAYKENKTLVNDSVRAGVHVHLNVQDLTLSQLYNMMVLYLIFEDILVEWCGEDRVGNLFCLRNRDADWLCQSICIAAQHRNWLEMFSQDELRYAAMNVTSLTRYGTLEFRSMKNPQDLGDIHRWVNILARLKTAAKKFEDPGDIITHFSMMGAMPLLREVFGEMSQEFKGIEDKEEKMFYCMRYAQDIAFCENFRAIEEEFDNPPKNPFKKPVRPVLLRGGFDAQILDEWAEAPQPAPGGRA